MPEALPVQTSRPMTHLSPRATAGPSLPQAYTNRYEIKYLVSARQLPEIRAVLGELLVPDSNNGKAGGYYNHSIYFDSPDYRYYSEKHEGEKLRLKPRLRFYRSAISDAPGAVHLELKGRDDRIVIKRRCVVDKAIADELLNSADPASVLAKAFEGSDDKVANEFTYLSYRYNLKPCVTVLYHREAFFSHLYKSLRVTYDSALLCSLATGSATPYDSYVEALPGGQVLIEVKYNDQIPRIMLRRLNALGLQQRTFSKFAVSLERCYEQLRSGRVRAELAR